MFFNNIALYNFKENVDYQQEEMEEALTQDLFRKCAPQDFRTFGWANALGKHGQTLSHFSNGFILLCAKAEEKILPAAAVNEIVQSKVEEVEQKEARRVSRKERDDIKESTLHQLVQQAFTKSTLTYLFIDLKQGYLAVNTTSFSRAENALALLRKSLGTLPVVPAFSNYDLSMYMRNWAMDKAPEKFVFGSEIHLSSPVDDGVVKSKGYQPDSEHLTTLFDEGCEVDQLSLSFDERIDFKLSADGMIKRITFSDVLKEENADIPKEDMAAKLDADFYLGASEVSILVQSLFTELGDPNVPQND